MSDETKRYFEWLESHHSNEFEDVVIEAFDGLARSGLSTEDDLILDHKVENLYAAVSAVLDGTISEGLPAIEAYLDDKVPSASTSGWRFPADVDFGQVDLKLIAVLIVNELKRRGDEVHRKLHLQKLRRFFPRQEPPTDPGKERQN